MKLIYVIPTVIIAVILAGLFTVNVKKKNTDITREKTKIAMIMHGTIDDHSWGQSHYEGMKKAAEKLNLDVLFREQIPTNRTSPEYSAILAGHCLRLISSIIVSTFSQPVSSTALANSPATSKLGI